jgi:hypothetical protein
VSTRLVQLRTADGERMVAITRNGETYRIKEATSIYVLAQRAIVCMPRRTPPMPVTR